jgi:hypothetical protein
MPPLRTEVTEIVTGAAMLGFHNVEEALESQPEVLKNVEPTKWFRLREALAEPEYKSDFIAAWDNGQAFLSANDGLRGRKPVTVEWKGPHHPPGYDFLPADLRIDHVFLVSCKYLSRVLANPSPAHLFERALAIRGARADVDWYQVVAKAAYRTFYEEVRFALSGAVDLPIGMEALTAEDREAIKVLCARRWPDELQVPYTVFSAAVSEATSEIWNASVPTLPERELMLWRILRFNPAPYFILGSAGAEHLRLRVATPWDWRQQYKLLDFVIEPQPSAQPRVGWSALVQDLAADDERTVTGHVEVRWSHGRFCGFPEAKVYLDSPHVDVPGYFPLV